MAQAQSDPGQPRRSQRTSTQTQFYGKPNLDALRGKLHENLTLVTTLIEDVYARIEVNEDPSIVADHFNEIVRIANHTCREYADYKTHVVDPELREVLIDAKNEVKLLQNAARVHKRAYNEFPYQSPLHVSPRSNEEQESECGSRHSGRSRTSRMSTTSRVSSKSTNSATSRISTISTASLARAEALKANLRLEQIEREAKLKLEYDRLKLTNRAHLHEQLANALEGEVDEPRNATPTMLRNTQTLHNGNGNRLLSTPRTQTISPALFNNPPPTDHRSENRSETAHLDNTCGNLFTKFIPGYGPDPPRKPGQPPHRPKLVSMMSMNKPSGEEKSNMKDARRNTHSIKREEITPKSTHYPSQTIEKKERQLTPQNVTPQPKLEKKRTVPIHLQKPPQKPPLNPGASEFKLEKKTPSPKANLTTQLQKPRDERSRQNCSTTQPNIKQNENTQQHDCHSYNSDYQWDHRGEYREEYRVPPAEVNTVSTLQSETLAASLLIQQKTTRLMYLNSIQPTKFGGQPKHFPHFKQRVDSLLADGVLAEHESVEMLPKFLEGEPLQVVKSMTGRSYSSIMSRLVERYGHPTLVANDHIQDLIAGPPLGNSERKGLLNLADALVTATDTLTGSFLTTVSCQPNMEKIVNRLPMYLRNSWEKKVSEICDTKPAPELSDLANFVEKAAKTKNNPFYQSQTQQPPPKTETKPITAPSRPYVPNVTRPYSAPRTAIHTMSTDVKPAADSRTTRRRAPVTCAVCTEEHKTWLCPSLKAETEGDREKLVRSKNLCIICFVNGCRHLSCPKRENTFVCKTCTIRHNKLLQCKIHPIQTNPIELGTDNADNPVPEIDHRSDQSPVTVDNFAVSSGSKDFMLGLVPVNVHGPDGKVVSTYAFLDTGSKASFIDESLANELGITGTKECRFVKTIVGRRRQNLRKVAFEVSNIKTGAKAKIGYQTYSLMGVSLEQQLGDGNLVHSSKDFTQFEHLKTLNIPVPERQKIGLLLGLPVREAHEVLQYHKGEANEPYGIESLLGVAVAGPMGHDDAATLGVNVFHTSVLNDPRHHDLLKKLHDPPIEPQFGPTLDILQRFWEMENYGTKYETKDQLSPLQKRALDIFIRTLSRRKDGHYESGLMWLKDNVKLPQNRQKALKHLKILLERFKKDPVFAAMYIACMNEYIEKGWAELVPEDEIDIHLDIVNYLWHFAISNPNKPGRVRCVLNAADETEGVSLNSLLIPGPGVSCSLLGVLLRSRFGIYCFAADIRAMFNQCFVRKEDRDALRFLWIDSKGDIRDYRMKVHVFGAADSPFCANKMLKQIGLDHKSEYQPEIIATIEDNFYVDDSMVTGGNPDKMATMATELKSLLAEGGMELTKFTSNCKDVLKALDPKDWAKPDLNLEIDPMPIERALGLQWNVAKDCFGYKITTVSKPDTLRGITSVVARTFDPIGGTAPVMLLPKRLIQDCFRRKCGWDDTPPLDIVESWKNWKQDFHLLEKIEIPRPYFPTVPDCRENVTLQLHLFSDSCDYATGAVAYLRGVESNGEVHVGFVMGKSKLLPLQPILYEPKGELKAAVDLVRLGNKLETELRLKLQPTVYWTDSELVLKYINNDTKTFKPFVNNRRSEIREKSNVAQWRHCPGLLNVADDASRGVKISDYSSNHRYLTGPKFLLKPETQWPKIQLTELADDDEQIKRPKPITVHKITVSIEDQVGKLILAKSRLIDMQKVTSWCLRFIKNCLVLLRKKKNPDLNEDTSKGPLTLIEIKSASNALIRYVQHNSFSEEIDAISSGKTLPSESNILPLNPFMDSDGLLRVGGRISKAPVDYCIRHPVILPKPNACHLSATIVINYHHQLLHGGTNLLLGRLCELGLWIIHARSFVRRTINDCVICRKRNAKPITQLMSDLPSDRLETHVPCFTNTGTDCFGPMFCKEGRRRDAKYYGVLFLCLNTKAIHLELVKFLTTDDFIKALMRFVALRNNVKTIRSDNGSNYIGAERELRELVESWNDNQIQQEMRLKNIDWKFQLPYASSMSGVWERQVKEVKRHIYVVLKTQQPDPDSLRTLLYEVASIVNQSPLSPVSDDPTSYDVITPAHFLFQRPATSLIPVPTTDSDNYYRSSWRQVQFLADCYWKRHMKTFIPSLQLRRKWQKTRPNLKVDDLVLLMNMDLPRSRWAYGRVLSTYPDKRGLVRSALVKTQFGEYLRPIQRLALIRASENEDKLIEPM